MIVLLLATAAAGEPILQSDTLVQVRHDLFGELQPVALELLRVEHHTGRTTASGFVGLETWGDRVDPDIYSLFVGFDRGPEQWRFGRQQAMGALRLRTFDGVMGRFFVGRSTVEAWGGVLRHQALDDLADGAGAGRVQLHTAAGRFSGRAGAQIEAHSSTLRVRDDAQLRYSLSQSRPAALEARAAMAHGESGTVAERLLVRGSDRFGAVRIDVLGERRDSVTDPARQEDRILEAFAPDGVTSASVGMALHGSRWAVLQARLGALTKEPLFASDSPREDGAELSVSWSSPRLGAWSVQPAYRLLASRTEQFHAVTAQSRWAASDATAVLGRAGWVPYEQTDGAWFRVVYGGSSIERSMGQLRVSVGGELASDATYTLDWRGTLQVGWVAR